MALDPIGDDTRLRDLEVATRTESGVHPGLARTFGEDPAALEAEIVALVLHARQALRRTYGAARGGGDWAGVARELRDAGARLDAALGRADALAAPRSDELADPSAAPRSLASSSG